MQVCPNCGEENPDRFRLCGSCGTQLAPEVPKQEVRKTVSIVFCDLKGSTSLGEKLDTERLREVLSVYFDEMRMVLERHGGTVEKFIGDAVMAVFGLPRLHEDDALRAVRAAWEMKQALVAVNERLEAGWGVRLENRTGVNTGEVVAGDVTAGQRLVTGDAVNTAARLEQAAPAMEILIGEPTYRLVRDAIDVEPVEPLELKGKAEPVPAYRLLNVSRADQGIARRLDAPMVGRTAELQVLLHAAERATSGGGPQLVTVFGPAGVGKSRLLREFLQRVGEGTTALRGRCLPYGDGITFWPLAEIVRAACSIGADESLSQARGKVDALMGDARDVAERVSAAIGLSDTAFPVEETFWATRRFLEISSGDRPTIVLIDDIHWAEDTFLDLVRYVVDTAEAPLVLVCSSRPDLLEEHAEWVQERERVRRVLLEPLSDEESTTVVENLLGTAFPDEGIRNRIIHAAGGNPLFVEQMLSMLTDEGVLLRTGEGDWILTCDPGTLTVPPSISALLTARLDRLGDAERAVIQRGAVIGQIFFRGAVEDLSPEEVRPYVDPSLRTLQTKELIRPNNSTFAGQDAFRFLHILIRDAAYQALLKRTRAELHERFVDWLERLGSDRLMEYEEIHGYHLEQAFLIRSELGTIDEHTTAIGRRGAAHLSSAGHRTLARGDMPAASSLLERASALLAPGDPERSRLLLDAAGAMIEAGEFARADEVLAHATEEAAARGDASVQATARVMRLRSRYTTNAPEVEGTLADELQRDLLVLEGLDDHAGLAQAWRLLTQVHATNGMYGKAEEAALQMIEHARLAGNPLMGTRHLNALAFCALYGPTPVPKAIRRCEDVLEQARGDRKAEAVTRCALAHLHAMRGDFDVARDLYRQSRATLQELGWKLHAATTSIDSGSVEMLAGDPVAAEAELRPDYEALQRMGDRNYSYTTAAFLAEALYLQGRLDEADGVTRDVEREAAEDDVTPQVLWRSVRAKILARKGMHVEAEELAREAVRLILQGDEPDAQGNALADLAEVLAAAGRRDEADAALADAIRRFEEKGNVVSARRARALVDV
jgi:class 3 adenylate cyclase/tetratricopeptide (TPR) repeat protein